MKYVVAGEVGEYSDRKVWGVAAFSSEVAAREYCELAAAASRVLAQRIQELEDEWPRDFYERVGELRSTVDPYLNAAPDLALAYLGWSRKEINYMVWPVIDGDA